MCEHECCPCAGTFSWSREGQGEPSHVWNDGGGTADNTSGFHTSCPLQHISTTNQPAGEELEEGGCCEANGPPSFHPNCFHSWTSPSPHRPQRCPAGLSESGSRVYTVTTLHIPDGDHNSPQTCRNSARPYPHGGGSKRGKQQQQQLGTRQLTSTSVAYAGRVVYKHITMQVKA